MNPKNNRSLSMKSSPHKFLYLLFSTYKLHAENKQMGEIMQSSSSLFSSSLLSLRHTVEGLFSEIKTVLEGETPERMLTIREEYEEEEVVGDEDPVLRSLNKSLSDIKYLDKRVRDTVQMYKHQLKRLATDIYRWEKKNKELRGRLRRPSDVGEENKGEVVANNPPSKEDKRLWESLNKKIEDLKKNLKIYQDEIKEKDNEILKLKQGSGIESEKEVRSVKRALTTMRGEKSLILNQFQSLKRVLENKEQILDIQNEESERYKVEIEGLNSRVRESQERIQVMSYENKMLKERNREIEVELAGLKEYISAYQQQYPRQELEDLRNRVKELGEENTELSGQVQQLEQRVEQLGLQLSERGECYEGVIKEQRKRNQEMEGMLTEKNETIVRLKSNQSEDRYQYYVELVKLLTKKVMERDEVITKYKERV